MTPPLASHLNRGRAAEGLAAQHLQAQGLELIAANYQARVGELDLVMAERRVLVVIEVRSRARTNVAKPAETVTRGKQRRLIPATRHFLMRSRQYADWPVRFDVVEITGAIEQPTINWIRAAFSLNDVAPR